MKTKIKIKILNYLFKSYLYFKAPVDIIKQDCRNARYAIKKAWTEFISQLTTWNEAMKIIKKDFYEFLRWVKKLTRKLYKMIDRGDPTWFPKIWIKVKETHKERKINKLLKSFLPDYLNFSGNYVFLHTNKIPKDSDIMLEIKKLRNLMIENGFEKYGNVDNDDDSIKTAHYKKGFGFVYIYVYLNGGCEIEYVDKTVKQTKITGLCKKFIDELNKS